MMAMTGFGQDADVSGDAIVELSAPDLAAMLCSRVCHDLINPVGAIGNGLEVLADPTQASMADFAKELIEKSTRQARARLEFARIAYGASSSAAGDLDSREAERVARLFLESEEKVQLDWAVAPMLMTRNRMKLLLNMVLIAAGGLLRGGTLRVEVTGEAGAESFRLTGTGNKTYIQDGMTELLAGRPVDGRVDARGVQPFYTGLLARMSGLDLSLRIEDGVLLFTAADRGSAATEATGAQVPDAGAAL